MKKVVLFISGLIPFLMGYLMNWSMLTIFFDVNVPYALISVITLLIWGLLGYFLSGYSGAHKQTVILMNLPAFIVLILNAVQLLIFKAYWLNIIGLAVQIFYLPFLNISFLLTSWSHSMLPAYIVAFILMVAASSLGCYANKKLRYGGTDDDDR
ncbi:MAG: hypothetical protein PWQ77_828 [Kosmotogales bacterium]|nr:hypothetical protein [Kosmotogales bacterium]